jgi:hypothetical protein
MSHSGKPQLQLVYSNGEALNVKRPNPQIATRPHCPGMAPTYYPAYFAVDVDGDQLGVRVHENGAVEFTGGYVPDRITEQLWKYAGAAFAKLLPRPERLKGGEQCSD